MFVEAAALRKNKTAIEVIRALKAIFAGIGESLAYANGVAIGVPMAYLWRIHGVPLAYP